MDDVRGHCPLPAPLCPLGTSPSARTPFGKSFSHAAHRLSLERLTKVGTGAIGFPEPARDAELLSRARRTTTGGWVVRLTDAPLDLDNPAHLDALKRAYERFLEVGGRAAP
jgi:Family of unknown function (DUF5953)